MTAVRPLIRSLIRAGTKLPTQRRGGGSTDADAAAWATAVTTNSGVFAGTTVDAMSTFAKAAKASGYWPKLNRINLFCGGATPSDASAAALAGCLVPLKIGGGGATDTNVNFVAGDFTLATGLTGNGSSKYLNTGLIPSASLTLNDTHLSVYNRSSAAAGGGAHIGSASSDTVATMALLAPFTDGNVYSDEYTNNATSGRATTGPLSTPFGFVVGSRTTSTAHSIYRNGASVVSNVSASTGALSTNALFVFATNSTAAGGPTAFASNPLAAYSAGSGLSAADVTAFNTHMQAFQTALGRNV